MFVIASYMASFFPFRSYKAWRLWEHRTPPHNYWTLLLCEAAVYSHRWKKCSTLVLYYNIWHIKAAWLCHPAEPHLEALKSYTFCNTLKVNGSFTRLKKSTLQKLSFLYTISLQVLWLYTKGIVSNPFVLWNIC